MYYYAYLDSSNVVTGVYALPSQITADGYVQITEEQYNDPTLVGKIYDPETGTFSDPQPWSCSTADVQYKDTTKSLSTKLDEMEEDIADAGVDAYTKTESDSRYATASHTHTGYAETSHTHTASDLSGVVKTINGTAPDTNGNVTVSVSGGGMTAGEILSAVKTVDGENSGLDADTVDGKNASDFATSDHTHTEYATANHTHTEYAASNHTHTDYATAEDVAEKANVIHTHAKSDIVGLVADLSDKADVNHTHTEYASTSDVSALQTAINGKADASHTHTGYATTEDLSAVQTAVAGKADATHTHSEYAASDHTHTGYATTSALSSLESTVSGKADTNHTHTGYASSSHTHSQSDITGLSSALSGKADTDHTHSGYASSSHTHTPSSIGAASASHTHSEYASSSHNHSTLSGTVNVTGAIKSNGVQVGYNSGSTTTVGSDSYPTNVAGTYVTLNGEKTYAPNIYPRNTGTFYLGAQSNRWSGIYSKVAVNVSSDERLKENVKPVDVEKAVNFIKGIEVKNFNFKGDYKEEIGIIAQQMIEADKYFSTYFVEKGEDGYYGVKTSDLVFPLIVAVQELSKEVEALKNKG